MHRDVVPVYRDRPVTLPDAQNPGWVIYVSVHDAAHLEQRKVWKRKLAEAHPDRGATSLIFHRVRRQYDAWLATEKAWYARLGLPLPDPYRHAPALQPLLLRVYASRGVTRRRVLAYDAEHPQATSQDVARALGISDVLVRLARKRNQGQPLVETPLERLLAFLADGRPHALPDLAMVSGSSLKHVYVLVTRLRARGFDVRTVYHGALWPRSYQLVYSEAGREA